MRGDYTNRHTGGRPSSVAEWLREAKTICDARYPGDRGRSPSPHFDRPVHTRHVRRHAIQIASCSKQKPADVYFNTATGFRWDLVRPN
jgi:hypothetical protein